MKFMKTLLLAIVLGASFVATSEAMYLDTKRRPRYENGKMAKKTDYNAYLAAQQALEDRGVPAIIADAGALLAATIGTDNFMTTLKATIATCGVATVVGILTLIGMDTSTIWAQIISAVSSLAIPAGATFLAYLKRDAIGGWLQRKFAR